MNEVKYLHGSVVCYATADLSVSFDTVMCYDTVMNCLWCDTDISDKRAGAKFCSDGHKLSYNRKRKIDTELVEKGLPPTVQASKLSTPPKKVDPPLEEVVVATLETYKDTGKPTPGSPEWYIHGTPENPNQTWDRVCVKCGGKYTTTLSLMRFCSQACKDDVMVVIANGPHPNYLVDKKQ